jgi:hypothetical protein
MPKDVDIINDNHALGLHAYRMAEQSRVKYAVPGARAHWVYDSSYTIGHLLATGAISDEE